MSEKTILQQAREAMNLSLQDVADRIDSNIASLSRIERAQQLPNRDLARRIFNFYGEIVELGEIYDPAHAPTVLDAGRERKLRQLARALPGGIRAEPTP